MSDPATYYFTQGVLGVTVLVLALVIRVLWNELKEIFDKNHFTIKIYLANQKQTRW